jgi:26S proteasome regulatory subunit N13
MPRNYMSFKAGRAYRRPGTNFVDPIATKGAIYVVEEEDGLVHFKWKNRETGNYDEVRCNA